MTRSASLLTRALPVAALLALMTTTAQAAGNPPVFYCDEKSMVDRQAEIFAIRQDFLPGLKEIIEGPPGNGEKDSATEQYAEYSAQLKELELGVASCKELRAFDRDRRQRPKDDDLLVPPRPVKAPAAEDDLLVPPRAPKPPAAEVDDDLLVPPKPPGAEADDDLLIPPPPPSVDADDDLLVPPRPQPR